MQEFYRVDRIALTNWPTFHDDCSIWKRRAIAQTEEDRRAEMTRKMEERGMMETYTGGSINFHPEKRPGHNGYSF